MADIYIIDSKACDSSFSNSHSDRMDSLDRFSTLLSKTCKFSNFRTLAKLNYGESHFSNPPSILSSIEFDKDDEFFATAGVSKKIKIYEYANVISEYLCSSETVKHNGFITSDLDRAHRKRLRQSDNDHDQAHSNNELYNDEDDYNDDQFGSASENFTSSSCQFPLLEISGKTKISCLSWNPYIKTHLISSDYEGMITLFDSSIGEPICYFDEHEKRAWSVNFNPLDPILVASGGDDAKGNEN